MATRGGFALPAYEVQNKLLDLSPINSALDSYQDQSNKNAQFGMAQKRDQREQDTFDETKKQRAIDRMGKIADAALNEQDQTRRGAMMGALYKMHPEMPAKLTEQGMDPNDHTSVAQFLKAQTSTYDPLGEKQKLAQIDASRANTAQSRAQTANIGKTSGIQEFEYAKRNGFAGTFKEWQTAQENRGQKFGLNPIAYQKPDGTIGYMVPSTSGQSKELEVPGGGKAMPKVADVQLPTEVITRDQFGNIIRREKKDIAGKEQQEELGKAKGQAQVNLPGVETRAQLMNESLDAVEKAITDVPRMTGYTGNLPNVTPAARDAQAKIDQVQGKVFLQAFDSIRGAGAITEQEGLQAKAAISRLQATAVGTPQYIAAINDVRRELAAMVDLAKRKAGGAQPSGGGWSIQRVQ